MDISRDNIDDLRWYNDGDTFALSVTQILDLALEEDTTGLEYWKEKHDGEGDSADWEHLFWYAQHRGTLCHYQALCIFEDAYEADDLWSDDEADSMRQMVNGPDDDTFEEASHDTDDIVYSVLKNKEVVDTRDQFDAILRGSVSLVSLVKNDCQYFVDAFGDVCELLGIDDDSVIAVEHFLLNDRDRYGGQTDIVYEAPDGSVVVADLKTSSGLRHKHRLQAVAYAKAVERAPDVDVDDVDRIEVIRIQPDGEEIAIHSPEVPEQFEDTEIYTDKYWFKDQYGNFEYDSVEDMWETFTQLSKDAHERVE